jgi:hypothetical protein
MRLRQVILTKSISLTFYLRVELEVWLRVESKSKALTQLSFLKDNEFDSGSREYSNTGSNLGLKIISLHVIYTHPRMAREIHVENYRES